MEGAHGFAGPLAAAALAALVHALLPFLFATAASGTVKRLYVRRVNRVPNTLLHEAPAGATNGMPAGDLTDSRRPIRHVEFS
jgi:hypothetical protein